jgi:hypothetical protein
VSSTIERVHYYERQYLRSFDLNAEQLYHIEMRRRLNLALHLWGIVDGLDLRATEEVAGLPRSFYVSRGMAIDAYGREIVLPVDYPIGDDDFTRNRIQQGGTCFVSIVYRRELGTPPSGGYRVCDIKDQFTRWRESYEIRITRDNPTPTFPPDGAAVTDPLSDDAEQMPWPVVLGTVVLTTSASGKVEVQTMGGVPAVVAHQRRYVGLRAQRVVTPAASVTSNAGEAGLPLAIAANVVGEKNVFVGSDFAIANTSPKAPPADPTKTTPPGTGVLKVADDMFVQGDFYAKVAGDWVTLKDYLQSFIPDVQVGRVPAVIPVPITTSTDDDPTTGDIDLELETRLQNPKEQLLMVAISSIDWLSQTQFNVWESHTDPNAQVKLRVDVVGSPVQLAANKFKFKIHWEIEPTSQQPPNAELPIRRFELSYTAVFNPA